MKRVGATQGFGLIEVMVGLVIGLVATVVMFQTFSVSERQKRTTTGVADAQSNGAIATISMERDIKMAGWGTKATGLAECGTFYTYLASKRGPIDNLPVAGSSLMASVIITDGGSGATDSIDIQYFADPSDANFKFGRTTLERHGEAGSTDPSAEFKVTSVYGCGSDGPATGVPPFALVSQGGNCMLAQITNVQASTLGLAHIHGDDAPYNPDATYMGSNKWPVFSKGATLTCFPSIYHRTYRVNGNRLELTQKSPATEDVFDIAPEILRLQAQYGIADTGDQKIKNWVDATGSEWAADKLTLPNIKRIKAVRIALLARSATFEKPDADGNCEAIGTTGWPHWNDHAVFDSTALEPCYRYKTFEISVPLRNIIWAKI